jgi:hypothetical protein
VDNSLAKIKAYPANYLLTNNLRIARQGLWSSDEAAFRVSTRSQRTMTQV